MDASPVTDAYAPEIDPATASLARLVAILSQEAMFAMAAPSASHKDALEGMMRRRAEAHAAALAGHPAADMSQRFDAWLVELTKALAPISPPLFLPMGDVVREHVTLEAGARGLRSLFSSKPSDKDVQRVKRLGTLAVRVLRAIYVADGPVDAEEARTLAALIGSFGLPDPDTQALFAEPPVSVDQLDVYGEIEAPVTKGLVRGAWLAAALDAIDPREDQIIRSLAGRLALGQEVETMRNEALARVEAQRTAGLAATDAIRFVLADRPLSARELATRAAMLMIPRRYREEALSQITHGVPVTLAKRYPNMAEHERVSALGVAWAAALHDDPSLARRALLRARLDRFAADIGEKGGEVRVMVEAAMDEVLAVTASGVR